MLELKLLFDKASGFCDPAYNRTMLELKLDLGYNPVNPMVLIIVQCLNWNSIASISISSDLPCL